MSRRIGEDRKRSVARLAGVDAERLAMLWLICKGYWPMARDYRGHGGEVDLIMRRGRVIVAVEVKARTTLDQAKSAITPSQIRRIAAGLRQFRAERRLDDRYTYRCDAVFVAPRRWPIHVSDIGGLD
ncbi:MAG: YraN family protein [Beijerinckiaceae bacterium]